MTNFQIAVKFTLEREGGYINDSRDSGGETNYGISKAAHPDVDIMNLTIAGAMAIYKRDYWDHYGLDSVSFPLCVCEFDARVQHGTRAVGQMKDIAKGDWKAFNAARREYYLKLAIKQPQYKKGWLNRINDLDKYAQIVMQDNQ